MRNSTSFLTVAIFVISLISFPLRAREINYKEIKASSTLPETHGIKYDVSNLYDRRISTCWIEGKKNSSGLGEWIEVTLEGGGKNLIGFEIVNGNGFDYEFWERHNRIKELEVRLLDGTSFSFTLKDTINAQFISFPRKVDSEKIRLIIKNIYSGTTFQDTCISELWFHDTQEPDYIEISNSKASSVLSASDESNYLPKNAVDRFEDTAWCEGKKDEGVGEWIQVFFRKPERPKEITILNGVAFSQLTWFGNNRAQKISVIYPSGNRISLTLEDKKEPQTFSLPGEEASNLKIVLDEIKKGAKYNDTCISEISFK